LFPMSSRLSYLATTSSPESDGELCGEERDSPRKSQSNAHKSNTLQDASMLFRATSDPNLARKDGTIKSEAGDKSQFPSQNGKDGQAAGTQDKYASVDSKSKSGVKLPVLPPKIDRQKKPSKKSAAERLFGHRPQHSPPEEQPPSAVQTSSAVNGPDYGPLSGNTGSSRRIVQLQLVQPTLC